MLKVTSTEIKNRFQTTKLLQLLLPVTMGILKFLKYKIKMARCNRKRLDKCFDKDYKPHNKYGADNNVSEDLIRRDGSFVGSFSWDEIASATTNFSQIIGYGGFSNVYLAQFPDHTLGAIKINSNVTERLYRVFKQELDILLHIHHHDHILKLLGFYDDQEKGLLVLEYIENGTLQEKLHGDVGFMLTWTKRMQIAYQIAQAIEHLHERCSPHVVHSDIKSSNILLDNDYNSKLCDFGSAKLGFCSALMSCKQQDRFMMTGSPGYVDPHYLKTGIASKKNDIYSFGVLILELITGIEAFSAETGQMLKSSMDQSTKLALDTRLNGNFDSEEANIMFNVARLCLGQSPTLRPSASDIVFSMQHQIPSIYAKSSQKKFTVHNITN